MLPKISPGRFQCFVSPVESGQQLALEAVEVVGGCGADMAFPVDGNPALYPRRASFGLRGASSLPRARQSCGVSPVCPASAT
jgi:hypothetical protein